MKLDTRRTMSSATLAALAATGKSHDEQQGQQTSVVVPSTAMRREHGDESAAAAAGTSAATLPKPAASSSFPSSANGNKTALHPAAAGAATAKNFYNFPPTLPPVLYTAMPYAPRTALATPMMVVPPTTTKMDMPPVATATKRTTSLKSGGEKPTKKPRLTLTAKSTMLAKNNIHNGKNLSTTSSSSASASVPPSSTHSAKARKLSDTEFAKYVASEFKRRGYIAAIQLKPFSSKTETGGGGKGSANKKRKGKQYDDGEKATATDSAGASSSSPSSSSLLAATSASAATSTTAAATATSTNDDSTPTRKKSSKKSLSPTRKSQLPPSPSPSLPSFSFFPSLSTLNSKQDATWDAMYHQLCDFAKKQHGKLPLSFTPPMPMIEEPTADSTATTATTTSSPAQLTTTEANTNKIATANNINTTNDGDTETKKQYEALYKWTKKQLSSWSRMKTDSGHNLSLERISKLHALDFEQYSTRLAATSSSTNLAAANAVPTVPAPAAIAAAVSSVGAGNNGMGNRIDVDPDKSSTNAQKWQEKFESLKLYKELHGDTNVSRKKDEVLSRWCATQRVRCKLTADRGGAAASGEVTMSDTKKNPLTREQFQQLKNIGFVTSAKRKKYDRSVLDRKWEEKFQELVRFKEEHGHCDVAVRKGFENLKQLATWAGLQRQKYRAKLSGAKSGRTTDINDEQIMKLGSLGFTFTLQDDFETRFNQLCQFKKEFGHTKVPVFYTGHNNLGRWAKRMRDGIRNSEPWMDEVRKTRLLGIDFDIAARRVFNHAPKKTSFNTQQEEEQAVATSTNARMDNSEFDFYYNDHHQGSL